MSIKLYRFLEAGEIIESGDEYFSMPSMSDPRLSSWTCRLSDIGRRVSPESGRLQMYRRLVNSPDQLADAKQQITRQAEEIKNQQEMIEEQRKQLQSGNSVIDSLTKEVRELKDELQEANSVLKQEIEQLYQQQAQFQESGKTYRYLDVGEIIQEGDEFTSRSGRTSKFWRVVYESVGATPAKYSYLQFRREIQNQKQIQSVPVQESGKGYGHLYIDEITGKDTTSHPKPKREQTQLQFRNALTSFPSYEDETRLNNLFSTDPDSPFHSQQDGSHYKSLPIQPVQYSQANQLDSCQHSVIKYVTRYKDKGGIKDLKKAIHFIQMLAWSEYGEKI